MFNKPIPDPKVHFEDSSDDDDDDDKDDDDLSDDDGEDSNHVYGNGMFTNDEVDYVSFEDSNVKEVTMVSLYKYNSRK